MERLIRGVIQLAGVPDIDDANANWRALEDADIEYSIVEDAKVFEYLRTFYQSVSAPPEFALVKEYFEKLDEIEVVERLNEIKRAVPYIRTNYLAIIKGEQERQSIKAVVRIARETAYVAEHGLARGKTVLRGPHQALELFEAQSSKLRLGGDDWRFVRPSDMVKPLEPIRQLMLRIPANSSSGSDAPERSIGAKRRSGSGHPSGRSDAPERDPIGAE